MAPVLLAAEDADRVGRNVMACLEAAAKTGEPLSSTGLTHADVFEALRPIYAQVLDVLRQQQHQPTLGNAVRLLRKHTLHCQGGCDRNSSHQDGDPYDPKQWNRALGEQVGYTVKLLSGKHEDSNRCDLPTRGRLSEFASDLVALYDHLQKHMTKDNDGTHARWRTGLTTMVACQFNEARGTLLYPSRRAAEAQAQARSQPKKIVLAGEKRKPTQLTLFQSVKRKAD